jgi:putative DNA methylase
MITTATPAFIETQFPVSKLSKESYKERKANYSQTLTGLGKWWGRKPLILVRATILGLLLPTSDDPQKDRDIFLKILTMDEEGLWRRKSKAIALKDIYARLTPYEREQWFDQELSEARPKLKKGVTSAERQALQRLAFVRLSYDEKLTYCDRPEQIAGPSEAAWVEINAHLGTTGHSLPELVRQLGDRQFGHVPRVGDAFCGGGSVPFEAARIGCEAYGSDLNPVAALLTWAALHITGGGEDTARQVQEAQRAIFTAVNQRVTEWGIEHNEQGWRADAYLYCVEVLCPECSWRVPLAPSWVIGEKTRAVAKLVHDSRHQRFEIDIHTGVSDEEIQDARKKNSTVKNFRLECPHCKQSAPIEVIRRHLRLWENDDLTPRPDDVFQERLYCIRWCLPNLERLLCIEQILQANLSEDYGGWTLGKVEVAIDSLLQFVTNEAKNQIAVARAQTWASEAHLLLDALSELKELGVDEEATGTERLETIRELGRSRKALPSEVQPIIEISWL